MERNLNLDVDAPDQVAGVLRAAAEAYYESDAELSSAWQDRGAGRPWRIIAQELEKLANRIDYKLAK